jgi:anaerobic dimethyl sulfoxide reductase subunit A
MVELKQTYGPTAILDQSYAGASYGVLHKSDQIEGLLGRFLGMFGCRTNSWSVPQLPGHHLQFSRMTFGTIEDGNEDDAFAHSKLIIMWGWNPAYTFHGGNTFYYMRMAKQRGCKFVLVDPQYTDSAAVYDAWWIPIKPNTDAAMMAGMAHTSSPTTCRTRPSSTSSVLGMDRGTMPKDTGPTTGKLQGLHPRHLRRRAQDPRVGRRHLRREGRGHPQAGRRCTPPPSRRR